MILLTTILTPLALIISFSIHERVKAYFALFMLLEMGMLGVFAALDLIVFFIFWEFGLVPMYFLIGPAEAVRPMPQWSRAEPAEVGMDEAKLAQTREYALTGGGSGYITRHGRLLMAWGDPRARYDLKSSSKRQPQHEQRRP